jgi:hypothetical protein
LVSLAAAARRGSDPALMWRHTQALPGGLPVVTAPPGADQARAALAALAPDTPTDGGVLQQAAGAPGVVVIADCGRLDPGSVAVPLVRGTDVVLLLTGAHADDLAHLAARLPTVGGWSRLRALLLVGDGYPPADVSRELGVPVLGRVPADPRGAALLRGHPARRGASRSGLGRSARQVAGWVTGRHPTPPAAPPHQPTAAAFRPPTSTVDTWSGIGTRSAIGTLAPIVAPRLSGHVGPDAGSRNGDRP